MSEPVDYFTGRVSRYCDGCPLPTVREAIVDTAIEFAEKTLALRTEGKQFDLRPGVFQYELDLPSQTELARVLWVSIGDFVCLPRRQLDRPLDEFSAMQSFKQDYGIERRESGYPFEYHVTYNDDGLLFNVYPEPSKALPVYMSLALRPVRDATTLDSDFKRFWLDPLVSGAAGVLMGIPDKSWTNPMEAQNMRNKFMAGVTNASTEADSGRVRGSQRVKGRQWYNDSYC